jgi:hemoglobin
MASLYDQIGAEFIGRAIAEFYRRAFTDGVIGHFFMRSDLAEITRQQTAFATALLGGPRHYRGKPLQKAHAPFIIKAPHFGRRQMLMAEVLEDLGLKKELRDAWLKLEEQLRPLVVNSTSPPI